MKKIMILFVCAFLSACGTTQTVLDPVAIKNAPVTIPNIPPIQTNPVQWQVLTSKDLAALAKNNPNVVVFGLDDKNFKNLNLNLSEATRYIQQEKAVNKLLSDVITSRQNNTPSTK